MNQETLWQAYNKLPRDAKQIVDELITFLTVRYPSVQVKSRKRSPVKKRELTEEPFIGIWKDREELTDSTSWLRSIRENEWTRERE
ncbi:MAG: hypothetical protein U0350_05120 [Caldilineaceae bacterium]